MRDIVKKILSENNVLKSAYYEYLDSIMQGDVELAGFNARLSSLCWSVRINMRRNTLEPQSLINILYSIEEYAVQLENEDDKRELEILFFEDILGCIQNLKEGDPNYRYFGLFKDNLGPASEELCERNNAFWRDLIQQKNEKYRS